jgi:hypothetical protein
MHPVDTPPSAELPVDGRPKATWRWLEALGVYLLGIVVVGILTLPLLAAISSHSLAELVTSIMDDVLLTGFLLLWLRRWHPGWKRAIGFPKNLWPEVRAGAGFGLLMYPAIVFGVGLLTNLVLTAISGKMVRAPQQLPSNLGGIRVLLAVVFGVLIAPAAEEFFFRGCLFRAIRDRYGFLAGGLGSAAAFGLAHYVAGPWQDTVLLMSVMVFTGFALAYLYERRGNLVANMVAHATFNVIGLTLILTLR